MKKITTHILQVGLILMLLLSFNSSAQQNPEFNSTKGKLVRVTPELSAIDRTTMYGQPLLITRDKDGVIGIGRRLEETEEKLERKFQRRSSAKGTETIQKDPIFPQAPTTTLGTNIDGQTSPGLSPTDNNIAVGPLHIIQMVNNVNGSQITIYDKSGNVVGGPITLASITGFAGYGDPVVLYDQLADRWIMTEFGPHSLPIHNLNFAVSTSGNPLGTWSIYQYTDASFFVDYQKFSVWHNAYYGTSNDFNNAGNAYLGSSVYAFDRAAMLAGSPTAVMVRTRLNDALNNFYNMGTIGLEGMTTSTQNGLFAYPVAPTTMNLFEVTPDFITPSITVGPTIPLLINAYAAPPSNVVQQGTSTGAGTLGERMMFKLNYRNNSGTESIVMTHTIANGSLAAVRWYELRRNAGSWTVYQQGTVTGADGNSRWMGGISMDACGNIALMYDMSGVNSYPSVKYTGRIATDPLNAMTLPEATIINGTVSHTANSRWGDYNTTVQDYSAVGLPNDGSFWSTSQYGNQSTRIANFTLAGGCFPVAAITPGTATIASESCLPNNNIIDPLETVTLSLCALNIGNANTTNLIGTMQSSGGVIPISGPQNYGVVTFGGSAVCQNFTFTNSVVNCGGTITVSIQWQDGTTNLGVSTWTFTLGTTTVTFNQNFDADVAPALPAGWSATNVSGPSPLWVSSNSGTPSPAAVSLPNSIYIDDPVVLSDKLIETPSFTPGAGAKVSFSSNYALENGFDGGVLEISVNSGAYQDIIAAGGSFVTGGYTSTISSAFGNPLSGRSAWTGNTSGFITTIVNLPSATDNQSCKIRFRMASDNSAGSTGWRIDNFSITQLSCCSQGAACTINLNSPSSNIQTLCINTSLATNIIYTTTGATGATFSGLPAGVTGIWNDSIITISGTPTEAGTFNYIITLTGGCLNVTAGGIITVNPNKAIALICTAIKTFYGQVTTSDSPTSLRGFRDGKLKTCANPFGCPGTTSGTFQYELLTWTNPIASPQCVTVNYSNPGVTFSFVTAFNGAPVLSNFCTNWLGDPGTSPNNSGPIVWSFTAPANATINFFVSNVNNGQTADYKLALNYQAGTCQDTQSVCKNEQIADIIYKTTGATGATFSGLPSGVTGNWANDTVTISGIPTVSGTYDYTVTLTGGCGTITANGTITVTPNNTITLTSAAGTNAQTVCINTAITNITYSTTGATGATFS